VIFDDSWTDYVATEFSCETCGRPLWRFVHTNLLTCLNADCDDDEPLFLVDPS